MISQQKENMEVLKNQSIVDETDKAPKFHADLPRILFGGELRKTLA